MKNKKKKIEKEKPLSKKQQKVFNTLKELYVYFGLYSYDCTVDFKDSTNPCYAQILVEEDYQRATFTIHDNWFFKQSPEAQFKTLIHELAHYLSNPLYDKANNLRQGKLETEESIRFANEESTSRIENIVFSMILDNKKIVTLYKNYIK